MIGMENEDTVDRPSKTGLILYSSHGIAKHHAEEIRCKVEVVFRIHKGLSDRIL